MTLLFVLFVLVGFLFQFIATWPGALAWSTRVAWGSWFIASLLWALPQFGAVHA